MGRLSLLVRYFALGSAMLTLPGWLPATALAQKADPADPRNTEIGRELIEKVIAARGGPAYTGIRTLVATGLFTPYQKGMSQSPIQFIDYLAYPDRERVEFGRGKRKDRRIQVNVGRSGWVYDGDAETIKDQTELQIRDYLESGEYDIDRLLRGVWKDPGVRVRFGGKSELRPGERASIVLIELTPDRQLSLVLDPSTSLPISLSWEKVAGGTITRREVRYFQYVRYDGILFPNIVDFYLDGLQESRVNYQTIRVGAPVGPELFVKPATSKDIK